VVASARALASLAERPAYLYFSGQAMMEIERILHATFSNGLSGPVFSPPLPKSFENFL
jgi:hypothetical protein